MDILKQLAEEFKIRNTQVENTVKLIDDGIRSRLFLATEKR